MRGLKFVLGLKSKVNIHIGKTVNKRTQGLSQNNLGINGLHKWRPIEDVMRFGSQLSQIRIIIEVNS